MRTIRRFALEHCSKCLLRSLPDVTLDWTLELLISTFKTEMLSKETDAFVIFFMVNLYLQSVVALENSNQRTLGPIAPESIRPLHWRVGISKVTCTTYVAKF